MMDRINDGNWWPSIAGLLLARCGKSLKLPGSIKSGSFYTFFVLYDSERGQSSLKTSGSPGHLRKYSHSEGEKLDGLV